MLIAHVVFRFDYGGLENGVVNIIRSLNEPPFQHVVIALTEATDFAKRLPAGTEVHAIGKQPGKDFRSYVRLYRLLRQLRPDIVHTRNIGTMECAFVAFLARVPIRIHGEHGWDVFDPDGTNRKYRFMRRSLHRFVHRIVTVSADLQHWVVSVVGIPAGKVHHICNGVDTDSFRPAEDAGTGDRVVVGSVTRFSAIKDPLNLVEAFVRLHDQFGEAVSLLMIGNGELHDEAERRLADAGVNTASALLGAADDVAARLRDMDVFVLGSLREGISNTILEAMASGLPIVATDTGGNPELVENGVNGILVAPGDRQALVQAIATYVEDSERRTEHGHASRARALSSFSIPSMIEKYRQLYLNAYAGT